MASNDSIIQSEKSKFNLDAPIIPTGRAPADGPIKSGTHLSIGAREHDVDYEPDGISGLYAMDCHVPPIFNLSVYDDMDSLYYNWNRVNHDNISDAASTRNLMFVNKNLPFDKLSNDDNNILKSWDENIGDWIDYNNYPVFDKYRHNHPSLLSNAFFFHNFLTRSFHEGQKNIAMIKYPRSWEQAVFYDDDDDEDEEDMDQWTLSLVLLIRDQLLQRNFLYCYIRKTRLSRYI